MTQISRRSLLAGGGGLSALALLAACGGSSGSGAGPGSTASLRWWDHFSALQKFHKEWAATEAKALGVQIQYTYNDVSKSTEALQLANQGKQLPDIYSNVVGLPLPALVAEGWLHEITLSEEAKAALPEGAYAEGITTIDGKLYGLPLFSFQQYAAAQWFNVDLVSKAGLDPDDPPTTYDEYRANLQKLKGGDAAPMVLALGGVARMREQMDDLAQAAGFPGFQGTKYTTGEFAYDDDTYVNAIEFWKELNDSGLILAGSGNLTVADARTRWASGIAAYFPDGPWCAGGAKNVVPTFVDTMGVGPILTPDGGTVTTYRGTSAAQFFIAGNTKNPEQANAVIESMTTKEYQKGLAGGMDQPPFDLSVVESADVIEPYKQLTRWFADTVKRAPEPIVRNPEIAKVQAAQKPVSPHLGDIVQGYLGGDVKDLKAALRDLNDRSNADRDQAIASATAAGATVSVADYAFSDWVPGQDWVRPGA
ncbi:ABC transporter substrate-binding protein [Kineococcus rhizosphaerae]|uniref:Multiple sugar transport system substrate-binding protein n=1 Tax=Kineococcus rhizosphaerae TaxID=559628 RepID=A0A2T0QXW8_9ACTN|nr:extracellular solute-binding protein [Kineococcus rhizosphaerae]PRY10863.1 multiple sugar transport system substrate-binding protein [Kineococcus rhizosphaerae]